MNRLENRRQRIKAEKAAKNAKPGQVENRFHEQQTQTIEQNLDIALQHHTAGRLPQAERIYQQVLQAEPNQPVALHLLGVIAHQVGKNDTAAELIAKAVAIKPDYAKAHNNLGNALRELGKLDEAVASYHKALAIDLDFADAHYNLGVTLHDLGRLDEAVTSYHKALAIEPGNTEALSNLGVAFEKLEKLDEAVASYHKVLAIKPDFAEALGNLGSVLKDLGRLDEAIACSRKALVINPDNADSHNNLGNALKDLGKLDEAEACYHKALAIKPDFAKAHSNLLYGSQFKPGVTAAQLKVLHAEWDLRHGAPFSSERLEYDNSRDPDRCLHIGFVSPDLGRHPVGYFLIGLLENIQQGAIRTICYSDRKPDDLTEQLKEASDGWVDIRGFSDERLSDRILTDRIDILFDLSGHTKKNRLLVFARKPAPIQITWAGYVGTTGLAAMDYLLSDKYYTPENEDQNYRELIIRLPDAYVCCSFPSYAPRVGSLPAERNGFITFGCFNNPGKINSEVVAAWSKVLGAVSDSRLVLKYIGIDDRVYEERFKSLFTAHGVEPSRLVLEGKSSHFDLLARYNEIDIALDPFPYSGGLTTCEALWMGVPVITNPGETFASRHSLSYLANVGLSELVSRDVSHYVMLAVKLANNLPRLRRLRSGLRDRMAKSPICDGAKFAQHFTAELRKVWREWCSGTSIDRPS